jgi:membrane protease subunit (stomatin/prohibitin family)
MKGAAKWIAIGWSIFCLFGIVYGMANVGKELNRPMNEYEQAGANVGVGCGMAMWVGIWAAIAGPAFLIYAVSGKKEVANAPSVIQKPSLLCRECGKYYDGPAEFCPNCGKPTKIG